jgi:hypothetical protein
MIRWPSSISGTFLAFPGINPTEPRQTTIPLSFTRWITHFCVPAFFPLTGTGAHLPLRKKSKRELSRFLLIAAPLSLLFLRDARPLRAFFLGSRRWDAALVAAGTHRWQGAIVLLPSSHPSQLIHLFALAAGDARYRQLHWRFESPKPRAVPWDSAAGMGIPPADRLIHPGCGRAYTLSPVPLLCRHETAS